LDALSESATVEKRCHRVQSELPELSLEDELEEPEDELEEPEDELEEPEDELEELEGVAVEAVESLEGFLLSFPA
jgi:predicted  nucleic acid-binding Zn-ribbon protein